MSSSPKIGQQTHFKIIFINKETEENQKHIDYRFSIQDPTDKRIDLQSPHSGWGVESASYTFEMEGLFKPRISIFNINFIPVEVGVTEFEMTTSAVRVNRCLLIVIFILLSFSLLSLFVKQFYLLFSLFSILK
jgi:hypothetical protein